MDKAEEFTEDTEEFEEIEDFEEDEDVNKIAADVYRRSEETAWHRWSTELEPHTETKEFFERHRNLIRTINKFAPLSYITDRRILALNNLRRLKIRMLENIGLDDEAAIETLKILSTYQESRGIRGFFTKALITRRTVSLQQVGRMGRGEEKKGLFASLFKKKPEKSEEEEMI